MSSTDHVQDINSFITNILLGNLIVTTSIDNKISPFYIERKNLHEKLWPISLEYSYTMAPEGKQITEATIYWKTKTFVEQEQFEQIINEIRRCAEHNIYNYRYPLAEDLTIRVVVSQEDYDLLRSQDLIFRADDDKDIIEDVEYMIEYGDNPYNTSLTESMSFDKVISLLESYLDKYFYVNVRSSDNDISAKEVF